MVELQAAANPPGGKVVGARGVAAHPEAADIGRGPAKDAAGKGDGAPYVLGDEACPHVVVKAAVRQPAESFV